ncbi:MAG: MarR family transcriptional regulator [Denitrovibrio sp.]|nr:MAG: MarR family transcriptional regulator [Denitrovibrio sp.]
MKRHNISYGKEADRAMRSWIDLVRVFTAIRAKEKTYIESNELTVQQFGVLEALYHLGDLTVGELTKLVLSTPGNMTVVISNLNEKGRIVLEKDSKDKRVTNVRITDDGKNIIKDMFQKHADNHAGYFSCLDEDEQNTLQELLRKLYK